ncbi:hypothetical protein AWT69_004021 [Pseudomonas putida]|nr:hypothetical protein AWT69_004021 [Pseudomonas putida]
MHVLDSRLTVGRPPLAISPPNDCDLGSRNRCLDRSKWG